MTTIPNILDFYQERSGCFFCQCGKLAMDGNACLPLDYAEPPAVIIVEKRSYHYGKTMWSPAIVDPRSGALIETFGNRLWRATPCQAMYEAAKLVLRRKLPLAIEQFQTSMALDWHALAAKASRELYTAGYDAYVQTGGVLAQPAPVQSNDDLPAYFETKRAVEAAQVTIAHPLARLGWDAAALATATATALYGDEAVLTDEGELMRHPLFVATVEEVAHA